MNNVVKWVIDIEANQPQEAADEALRIMLNPGEALFFDVKNKNGKYRVDLNVPTTIKLDMTPEEQVIKMAESLIDKFIGKVDSGRARSVETYAECKILKIKIQNLK